MRTNENLYNNILKAVKNITTNKNIKKFIKLIPKIEIHVHIEALVSINTLVLLNKKYKIDSKIRTNRDFVNKYNVNTFKDLKEMIIFFYDIQNYFKKEEDLVYLIHDAKKYMVRNNIEYMEFFFAPTLFVNNGHDIPTMLSVIGCEIEKIEAESSLKMRMILDVSRSFGVENALDNFNCLEKYLIQPDKKNYIIGIGLGGQEKNNPAANFKFVFNKARRQGFNVVAHAGEEVGPESIWSAIKDLKAQRIGHGTSAMFDDKLIEYLVKKQIPLEVCMTSNVKTKMYVKDLEDHPVKMFYEKGIMVTINSDDPILFNVELNDEFYHLYSRLDFELPDILEIIKNNLFATFLSDDEKNALWKRQLKFIYYDIIEKNFL